MNKKISQECDEEHAKHADQTSRLYGGVAQLGEHLPCKQGVRSSILLISTKGSKRDSESDTGMYGLIAQQARAHA